MTLGKNIKLDGNYNSNTPLVDYLTVTTSFRCGGSSSVSSSLESIGML